MESADVGDVTSLALLTWCSVICMTLCMNSIGMFLMFSRVSSCLQMDGPVAISALN
jgi:hypothetical protein